MILTPDGFLPDHSASADDAAIAHVFIRDQLVQPADAPALLPWGTYRELGLVAERHHVIGRHEGVTHVAVALAESPAPPSLPTGWRASGIRSWFGVLPDTQLAIAMRGVQLLEWERTHRFCGACGTATERVAARAGLSLRRLWPVGVPADLPGDDGADHPRPRNTAGPWRELPAGALQRARRVPGSRGIDRGRHSSGSPGGGGRRGRRPRAISPARAGPSPIR